MPSCFVISSIGSALRMGSFCVAMRKPPTEIVWGFFVSGETAAWPVGTAGCLEAMGRSTLSNLDHVVTKKALSGGRSPADSDNPAAHGERGGPRRCWGDGLGQPSKHPFHSSRAPSSPPSDHSTNSTTTHLIMLVKA